MLRFFKRLMFGSAIQRTAGDVPGTGSALGKSRIKVHVLENGRIGVELIATTFLSYQMLPATLSQESARILAQALEQAAAEAQSLAP